MKIQKQNQIFIDQGTKIFEQNQLVIDCLTEGFSVKFYYFINNIYKNRTLKFSLFSEPDNTF